MTYKPLRLQDEIRQAYVDLERIFRDTKGAVAIRAYGYDGYLHGDIWGAFDLNPDKRRYWIGFGLRDASVAAEPGATMGNPVFEACPPKEGDSGQLGEGLFVQDQDGARSLTHSGNLAVRASHPNVRGVRTALMAFSERKGWVDVDGKSNPRFLVTPIDAPPSEVLDSVGHWVRTIDRFKGERDLDPTPDGPTGRYTLQDIGSDGCFLDPSDVHKLFESLRVKKNLILQGPPGTGKTWLAKRLAFALICEKDDARVRSLQFHPNLSYEDFVRGWRPAGEGRLELVDGVFMEAIKAAESDGARPFVVVVEEINRGNPAQVFGEMLTLMEAGKRSAEHAIELSYPDADGRKTPVYVPENLYVIGTMNLADRSLALMDFAFRRRFAFATLEPTLGPRWRSWVTRELGVDADLVTNIEDRVNRLNERIAADGRLGKQFCVGHSFVTPNSPLDVGRTRDWFQAVVEREIRPLLEEYWFDSPESASDAVRELLSEW